MSTRKAEGLDAATGWGEGWSAVGVELLKDGTVTELYLASFGLADAELRVEGADDPAFAMLKVRYADVLGGAPSGMPPDRGMELELETGDRKPDGSRRICYHYRGLNAVTRPAVEPLPHTGALLDGTRASRFFTKLDLASSCHQLGLIALIMSLLISG